MKIFPVPQQQDLVNFLKESQIDPILIFHCPHLVCVLRQRTNTLHHVTGFLVLMEQPWICHPVIESCISHSGLCLKSSRFLKGISKRT